MRGRVKRSSIVDSYGIGRSTPTAWCFVQAEFPFKVAPISQAKCGRFRIDILPAHRGFAKPFSEMAV